MEDNKIPGNEIPEDESVMDVLKRIETKVDANDNSKLNREIDQIPLSSKEKREILEAIEAGDPRFFDVTDFRLSNEDGIHVQQYLYDRMKESVVYTNTFKMWRVITATVCVILISLFFIGSFPVVLYYSTPYLLAVKNYELLAELYIFGFILFALDVYKVYFMIRKRTSTKQIKFFNYFSVKVYNPSKKGYLFVDSHISIYNILQIVFGLIFGLVMILLTLGVSSEYLEMYHFRNSFLFIFTFFIVPITIINLLIDMKILSVTFKTKNLKIVAWHSKYIIYFINNLKNVK